MTHLSYCFICGWRISGRHQEECPWLAEYRCREFPFRSFGQNRPRLIIVSLVYVDRETDDILIGKEYRIEGTDDNEVNPPETGGFIQPAKDFACHSACWDLLEHRLPGPPDAQFLRRLWEVCRSLPHLDISYVVDWGHDYGGVFLRLPPRLPWDSEPLININRPPDEDEDEIEELEDDAWFNPM